MKKKLNDKKIIFYFDYLSFKKKKIKKKTKEDPYYGFYPDQ
jgi:hypothetical protein